jgi:hypothetical protein
MNKPKGIGEMVGLALRERAARIVVFVPLDVPVSKLQFSWKWVLATFGIGAPLFAVRAWFERQRGIR